MIMEDISPIKEITSKIFSRHAQQTTYHDMDKQSYFTVK